ncbi:MAG TPA: lyase family protein [Longimicrobium sp.]
MPCTPLTAAQTPPTVPGARMWGGRFSSGPAPEMDLVNRSLPVDRRLWRHDVAGSRAWASALGAAGVITLTEAADLRSGLDAVAARLEGWTEADWAAATDEDVHTLVERLLGEEAGPVAGKLHTGRSRNDQVATDFRLYGMEAAAALDLGLRGVQQALVDLAEAHVGTVMPAYTHMQRAQPVSAAHWLLSHAWPLARDRERLADASHRIAVLPLGSGAIAGCPFPVDRVLLKESALEFAHSRVQPRHRAHRPEARVGGDLVVTRAAGVELPRHVAGLLVQQALDERVHVLVVRAAPVVGGPALQAGGNGIQPRLQPQPLRVRDDPRRGDGRGPRLAPRHVLAPQTKVHGQRAVQPVHLRRRLRGEAAAPELGLRSRGGVGGGCEHWFGPRLGE